VASVAPASDRAASCQPQADGWYRRPQRSRTAEVGLVEASPPSEISRTFGRERAEIIQLAIEYDPQPPVDAGSPAKARPEIVTSVQQMFATLISTAN
jgi:hypothetical protein